MDSDANENKKTLLALLILVVLLSLLSFGIWWLKRPSPSNVIIKSQKTAPIGTLVEGLSNELILAKDASVIRSDELEQANQAGSSEAILKEVVYATNDSLNDLFASYLNYMQVNGYLLYISQVNPDHAVLVATKDASKLTVSIAAYPYEKDKFKNVVGITVEK